MTAGEKKFAALQTEGTSRDSQGFRNEGIDPETVVGLQDVGDNRSGVLKGYGKEITEVITNITKKASRHNIDMTLVEDMSTEMRMTIKKRKFPKLENGGTSTDAQRFDPPNTNPRTEAASQSIQDDCPDRPEKFNKGIRNDRVRTRKNASRRKDFFENLQDEIPLAEVENGVTDPMAVGQASYQRTREGVMVEYKDTGDDEFQCAHCHAHFWLDEANQRTSRTAPIIYTRCCQKGQVQLPEAAQTPNFLEQLLNPNNGRQSLIFRDNIQVYNSMFAFTSMGAKIDKDINNGSGPYVFKICGQVHPLMGSILPPDGEYPKYAQLYVYDTRNEIRNRIKAVVSDDVEKIKSEIVQGLMHMFDNVNELVKSYRTVRDKFEDGSLPSYNITIMGRQPNDSKQYEEPIGDEIGGLIVGDIGEFNSNKDIIIQSNEGYLQRISRIHPKCMSLQYPILFPYGEDGYKLGLKLQLTAPNTENKRDKLSMRSFITYQIHDRGINPNTLLKGERLFQQYLVDAYATVEEDRLYFIRKNNDKYRTEKRDEIYTAHSGGANLGRDVGQKNFLPSSHIGSPRDMINNYQDAMAICRQYGTRICSSLSHATQNGLKY